MTDTKNIHIRHLMERFHSVATRKFSRLTDVYDQHEVEPGEPDDNRAMAQCQSAGRSILAHITLLKKALLEDALGASGDAAPGVIGEAELQAIVEDAREHV